MADYKINPALNRAIRNKLDSIDSTSAGILSGELPVPMAHGMIRDETSAIRKLLCDLGGLGDNSDGLKGTLDRASGNLSRMQLAMAGKDSDEQ